MYSIPKTVLSITIAATFSLAACSKDDAKKAEDPAPAASDETKTEGTPTTETKPDEVKAAPSEDHSFAAGMMKPYEECRALLAADKTEGIADCANGIAEAAKSAHAAAPEATHEHITDLATAAEALAKAKSDDIAAVRLSFGEVSKSAVAMLVAAPKAAQSYHLFECPMAKGYKKWAQPGATLENPYMGAKMLSCGSELHDHQAGMKEGEMKDDHGKDDHGHAHEKDDKGHAHGGMH